MRRDVLQPSALTFRGVQKWDFKREYLYAPFLSCSLAQRALLLGAHMDPSFTLCSQTADGCANLCFRSAQE